MPRSQQNGNSKALSNKKDKKIKIIAFDSKQSIDGKPMQIYFLLCPPVWASYRSVSGSEFYAASHAGFEVEAIFTVNWRKDITAGMYILWQGKGYKITYVDNLDGSKKDLKLHCSTYGILSDQIEELEIGGLFVQ